jgi:hypothetical protein
MALLSVYDLPLQGIPSKFAVWRGRNVYIFEPAYPKELKDEDAYSTTYSSSEHVNWKLHSDIRFAAQVKDARLGRSGCDPFLHEKLLNNIYLLQPLE